LIVCAIVWEAAAAQAVLPGPRRGGTATWPTSVFWLRPSAAGSTTSMWIISSGAQLTAGVQDPLFDPGRALDGDERGPLRRSASPSQPWRRYRPTHRCAHCRETPNLAATCTPGRPSCTTRRT